MNLRYYRSRLMMISLMISIFCANSASAGPNPVPGTYQGNLIEQSSPAATASPKPELMQYSVSLALTRPSKNSLRLTTTVSNPEVHSVIDLSWSRDGRSAVVNVSSAGIVNQILVADGPCYTSSSPLTVRLCVQKQSITLSAQDSSNRAVCSLNLKYFGHPADSIALEKPQSFTLDEAVARTLKKDFNSEIEFQQMLQSRYSAQALRMSLLPHLSNNSLLGYVNGSINSVLGVLQVAGDLVPFLFPSRWLQVRAADELTDAQMDALAIMRGGAALNVEILADAIDHDTRELAFLQKDYDEALAIRFKTSDLEAKGLVPAGTTAHLDSVMLSVHDAMDDISYPLQAEYASLSQAMGFVNPLAVSSITVPDGLPPLLNGQRVLQLADFQGLVLQRSYELQEMDHLIASAKSSRSADEWMWLDPAASITQALGFGLGSTLRADRAAIAGLQIQKNQTASTLLQNLDEAIIQYNHSVDDIDDCVAGIALEQDRIDALMKALDSGKPVSETEIVSVTLDLLHWQINSLDAELDRRTSLAILQRMLLQGYYQMLDGKVTALEPR